MMKHWHYLQQGDQVDIIAPGYGCPPEMLLAAKVFLESIGLVARVPEVMFGEDPFCSHKDEERLRHLYEALANPHSKALWCIRGGYGSARLISGLNKLPIPQYVKLLIGFSDITALHLFVQQHYGWPTLHAGVLSQFCGRKPEDATVKAINAILYGAEKELLFEALVPLNAAAAEPRAIVATVTGGNLSLIQTSIGTSWQLEGKGKIMVIEEVGERGYRIDRMLTHISQSVLLEEVQAVMIGDITEDDEKDGRRLGDIAVMRFAESCAVPVLRCPGIGHGVLNHPLPLGTDVTLTLGISPSLQCNTGGA